MKHLSVTTKSKVKTPDRVYDYRKCYSKCWTLFVILQITFILVYGGCFNCVISERSTELRKVNMQIVVWLTQCPCHGDNQIKSERALNDNSNRIYLAKQ